jgi:PhnB protein
MSAINPYLNFNGNTEEAFNFYKSVFGGEFMGGVMRYKDMPDGDQMPEDEGQKVMHVTLPIKDGYLMGTDTLESMGQKTTFGDNCQIIISPDSREEADTLFSGLSAGGKVETPMQDMFWGAYFGAFTDKFDVKWMVHFNTSAHKQ